MAIPESQLDIWCKQGSVTQSASTYAAIKGTLEDPKSPCCSKSFHIFLQGSYDNDTNVYKDSDVDVVIRLNSTYYYDLDALGDPEKAAFNIALSPATYSYVEFKADVLKWLLQTYGTDVSPGTKAITIKARNNRREADVLPCTKFRRYLKESNGTDSNYAEGICFFRTDGTRIENFPKQHSDNCTTKHQYTSSWFKPMVRVVKNMRNRMVDDGIIIDGLVPSYFIEGMLWNVPNNLYGTTYTSTFAAAVNWLVASDKSKLVCANGLHWLCRDNRPTSWKAADCEKFLERLAEFWNNWK